MAERYVYDSRPGWVPAQHVVVDTHTGTTITQTSTEGEARKIAAGMNAAPKKRGIR